MKELRAIVAAYGGLCERGEAGVLASVVRTAGSTYRRPGARWLWRPDGPAIGLVAGGCLEGDLAERARAMSGASAPLRVRYEVDRDQDLVFGSGLGCKGVVELLLERVDRDRPGPLLWLRDWLATGRAGAIATRRSGAGLGWRAARDTDGHTTASSGPVPPEIASALDLALREQSTREHGDLVVEYVPPPIRLAVFGAGPDAEPLVDAALALGWSVVVADHRPAFAKPERFAGARVVLAGPESAPSAVRVDAETYAVVMTHRFPVDLVLLRGLLAARVAYTAVLGPRQRTEDLLEALRREGALPEETSRGPLFAPAGLDLGAEAPEEIALSITSEILAVARSRTGGFLRERCGPIHDAIAR